ncbi:DUF732 domain-containing protein [Streptomyces noboritoensis]|uniref:DUF732 domain-containing protein n=1 Tax=Streptomyces noboritoensis TaxID=67337 RepID=A0ABV6TC65_9ACTN
MTHSRISAAALIAAAVLLLTACGGDDQSDSSPAALRRAAEEAVYAMQAAKGDPGDLDGVPPDLIAPEGRQVCRMLDEGQAVDDAIAYLRLGFNLKETGALIGAAPALCPQHQGTIDAWVASLG